MAEAKSAISSRPAWVDLATSDVAAAAEFYSRVFGWDVHVSEDPQYGGYAMAHYEGGDAAGIGPKQMPEAPTAWSLYIGTEDIGALSAAVKAAGGTVIVEPMAVGDQGQMAVYQDPIGAYISAWQAGAMESFLGDGRPNTFGWAELQARGLDRAVPFYEQAFGWTATRPGGGYVEFAVNGDVVAGASEINEHMPAEMPSNWLVSFSVADVDETFRKVIDAGGSERMAPMDYSGGRFAVIADPQGAAFGIVKQNR